jgi:RNA polymerase sigma-70 factor, ECF subfamily
MGVAMTQPRASPPAGASENPELRRRFAQADPEAFDEVVRLYGPKLQSLTRRLLGWPRHQDAQDALQEVLMNAFTHCRSFRCESSLLTWLTRLTINTCRTCHRRRFARSMLLERLAFWRHPASPAETPSPESDSTSALVQSAVRALPAKDRELIILHYLEDHPVALIAELLRLSPAAIHVRLHRARRRLAATLGPLLEDRHV